MDEIRSASHVLLHCRKQLFRVCGNLVNRQSTPPHVEALDDFAKKLGVERPIIQKRRKTMICPSKTTESVSLPNSNEPFERTRISCREVEEEEMCAICTTSFLLNEEVAVCGCHHSFHVGCIRLWLNRQRTCPLCRRPI
jgi:hypothetical protein